MCGEGNLPFIDCRMDESGLPSQPKPPASSTKKDAKPPVHTPPSRRTRSQTIPDWTEKEILTLVSEVAAVDDGWMKALSSFQRWKMISDNCMQLDVKRPSNECKRKWESLLADFSKIKEWELRVGAGSYWALDGKKRKMHGLPVAFYEEVFGSMDAVINTIEEKPASRGSGSEELVGVTEGEMLKSDDGADSDFSGHRKQSCDKTQKDTNSVGDMADKLRESAERVHTILRGEITVGTNESRALVDLSKPNSMEIKFIRGQADELISALRDMVGNINQFTELFKDNQSKEI